MTRLGINEKAVLDSYDEKALSTLKLNTGLGQEEVRKIVQGSGMRAKETLDVLTEPSTIEGIKGLQDIGFTNKNLTGLFSASCKKTPETLEIATKSEVINGISRLIEEVGMRPKHISGIIQTVYLKAPNVLSMLTEDKNIDALSAYQKQGGGVDPAYMSNLVRDHREGVEVALQNIISKGNGLLNQSTKNAPTERSGFVDRLNIQQQTQRDPSRRK